MAADPPPWALGGLYLSLQVENQFNALLDRCNEFREEMGARLSRHFAKFRVFHQLAETEGLVVSSGTRPLASALVSPPDSVRFAGTAADALSLGRAMELLSVRPFHRVTHRDQAHSACPLMTEFKAACCLCALLNRARSSPLAPARPRPSRRRSRELASPPRSGSCSTGTSPTSSTQTQASWTPSRSASGTRRAARRRAAAARRIDVPACPCFPSHHFPRLSKIQLKLPNAG